MDLVVILLYFYLISTNIEASINRSSSKLWFLSVYDSICLLLLKVSII